MRRLLLQLALLAPLASCSVFVMEPTGFRTGPQPTCTSSIKWGVVDALVSLGASGTAYLVYEDEPDGTSARESIGLGLGLARRDSRRSSGWRNLCRPGFCHASPPQHTHPMFCAMCITGV